MIKKDKAENFMVLKCLVLSFSFIMLFVSLSETAQSQTANSFFGYFKQYDPVYLTQSCSNATSICVFCNISSLKFPNSSIALSNLMMTKLISGEFNYTVNSSVNSFLGDYLVSGFCGDGNQLQVFSYTYTITPSGNGEIGSGEGISLVAGLSIIIIAAIFFLILFFSTNNQLMKSIFVGVSGVLMLAAVLFGMSMISQTVGGFTNLVTGYYAFYWLIGILSFIALFSLVIFVFVRSLQQMKIRRGLLDVE